ncbi:MAG: zinc-ribbon domain-containing protein [Spirochaetales bacterium]
MKQLKCPNCGAKVSRKTMRCDYCGTQLIDESAPKEIKLTHEQEQIRKFATQTINEGKAPKFILITFLIIWVTLGSFGVIEIASNFSPFAAIPAFAVTFGGVAMMIYAIKQSNKMFSLGEENEDASSEEEKDDKNW